MARSSDFGSDFGEVSLGAILAVRHCNPRHRRADPDALTRRLVAAQMAGLALLGLGETRTALTIPASLVPHAGALILWAAAALCLTGLACACNRGERGETIVALSGLGAVTAGLGVYMALANPVATLTQIGLTDFQAGILVPLAGIACLSAAAPVVVFTAPRMLACAAICAMASLAIGFFASYDAGIYSRVLGQAPALSQFLMAGLAFIACGAWMGVCLRTAVPSISPVRYDFSDGQWAPAFARNPDRSPASL